MTDTVNSFEGHQSSEEHLVEQLDRGLNLEGNCNAIHHEHANSENSGDQGMVAKCDIENALEGVCGCDPPEQIEKGTTGHPGNIEPASVQMHQYPPGIRPCVELQMVTISQDPRLYF